MKHHIIIYREDPSKFKYIYEEFHTHTFLWAMMRTAYYVFQKYPYVINLHCVMDGNDEVLPPQCT